MHIGLHCASQHDAWQVVVGKGDWPLVCSAGQHGRSGTHFPQALSRLVLGRHTCQIARALCQSDKIAVVDAKCGRVVQQCDVRVGPQCVNRGGDPVGSRHAVYQFAATHQAATQAAVLGADDGSCAAAGGSERCCQPGRASTHHQHIAMGKAVLVVVWVCLRRRTSHAGGAPDQMLVAQPPGGSVRPHECFVVEPGWQEGRQRVVDCPDIKFHRRPTVLAGGAQAFKQGNLGRSRVGFGVRANGQLYQRVGLLRASTKNAAWPVVFEAAADQVHAVGKQG